MFILTKIADVIPIIPADFAKESDDAVEDNINRKYANKVIHQVGLCICFYDLLEASEGLIGQGDGIVHVNVTFRMLVFRPFKGEIIEGTIADSSPAGISITLDFFHQIHIPPSALFQPSHYDAAERVWIWTTTSPDPDPDPDRDPASSSSADNDNDEPQPEPESSEAPDRTDDNATGDAGGGASATTVPLYFDRNERVRFRVEEEVWGAGGPAEGSAVLGGGGVVGVAAGAGGAGSGSGSAGGMGQRERATYRILGSMSQGGLGVTSWW